MAKIGTTTKRWTRTLQGDDSAATSIRRDYGLRDDGVLLRKVTFLNPAGSVDFTDGWKVVARDPAKVARITDDLTMRLGFARV